LTDDLFRSSIEPLSSNTSTLTAEEAAIRWATQNGRTLNI
jgi:hypothetical protein